MFPAQMLQDVTYYDVNTDPILSKDKTNLTVVLKDQSELNSYVHKR